MRTRYRFLYRSGDYYYWESARPVIGSSLYEAVRCRVGWFWSPPGAEVQGPFISNGRLRERKQG